MAWSDHAGLGYSGLKWVLVKVNIFLNSRDHYFDSDLFCSC